MDAHEVDSAVALDGVLEKLAFTVEVAGCSIEEEHVMRICIHEFEEVVVQAPGEASFVRPGNITEFF